MKIVNQIIYCTLFSLTITSCKKSDDIAPAPEDFIGTWTISKVYGNDTWGTPWHWKDADGKTKVKFTSTGDYYRQRPDETNFTLIGSYNKQTDSTILIIPNSINGTQICPYTLNYKFEIGGYMTWWNFGFEGIIKEKYKKD